MVSQKNQILTFLSNNSDMEYDSIGIWENIFKNTNVKPSTIRGRLSELEKAGLIGAEKEKRPFKRLRKWYFSIDDEDDFYVKILKTGASGFHAKKIVASTWEHSEGEKDSRFKELKKRMEEFAELDHIPIDDFGYSNVLQDTEPFDIPEFDINERATESNGNNRLGIEVHTE